MKAVLRIIFLSGIIVSTAFSCETNEENIQSQNIDGINNEDTISIEIRPLGELGFGADTLAYQNNCGTAINYKDKQFIIQSDNDYNELMVYAECLLIASWPQVNFKEYTLLAGVAITGTISIITEQSVKLICKENKIVYYVKIEGGGLTAIGTVFYWVLIPKTSSEQEIKFEILME